MLLLSESHDIDEQEPADSVVAAYCDQVVYSRDKGTGCYRRVDLDALEEQRDQRAYDG